MKTIIKKLLLLQVVLILLVIATACNRAGSTTGAASPFSGEKIVVHGLKDQDFEITQDDLRKLKAVTRHGEATRTNGEKISVDATGPLLDTFLHQYGKSQKDFSRIRFTARDKYSIAVPHDILENRQIILSYINDGKPLKDDCQPVRIVIPGERSMYWVREMIRMDFETGDSQKPVNKLVFLETAVGQLPQEDYQYYDSTDKAVKTEDLITRYADINDQAVTNVLMKAGDGLQKYETRANFLGSYLKITGKEAPKFIAPQLPEGMHIRDLLFIIYGQTAFFDYTEGIACLPKQTVEGKEGIALSQIIKQTGMAGGNWYKFTGVDGESVELETDELGNGLIYQNTRGDLTFISPGISGKSSLNNLLLIEVDLL
ncbi:MAG: molybdopterin-dependent oxidoreductase [Eubacteriales bacterium]|jgi:hypothetical protein